MHKDTQACTGRFPLEINTNSTMQGGYFEVLTENVKAMHLCVLYVQFTAISAISLFMYIYVQHLIQYNTLY